MKMNFLFAALLAVTTFATGGRWNRNSRGGRYGSLDRQCSAGFIDPSYATYEIIFVVDNSCGLSPTECSVQLNEISKLFKRLKVDTGSDYTKVAYIEYCETGAVTKVSFNDYFYQKNAEKYLHFIRNEAGCGMGGYGQTDAVSGLQAAIDEYLSNGDNGCHAKRKIIMINNCENTAYFQRDHRDFEDIVEQLEDPKLFTEKPDLMIFNVPAQCDDAPNSIADPFNYLSSLVACGDSVRPPYNAKLCVAPSCALNDLELNSRDFSDAAVVMDGRIVNPRDKCYDEDILCDIVGTVNGVGGHQQSYYSPRDPAPWPAQRQNTASNRHRGGSHRNNAWPAQGGSSKSNCRGLWIEWNAKCNGQSWTLWDDRHREWGRGSDRNLDVCCDIDEIEEYTLSATQSCGAVSWICPDQRTRGSFDFGRQRRGYPEVTIECFDSDSYSKRTRSWRH